MTSSSSQNILISENVQTIPPKQKIDEIEVSRVPYLCYRDLRTIRISQSENLFEEDDSLSGISRTMSFAFMACGIMSFWSGFSSLICSTVIAKTLLGMSVCSCSVGVPLLGISKCTKVRANTLDNDRLSEAVTHLCNEGAEGDEDGKVIPAHLINLYPLLSDHLLSFLDFEQSLSLYGNKSIRPYFLENIDRCNPKIAQIWKTVSEHHELSTEEFLKRWNNDYYRLNVIGNGLEKSAILNFLPDHLLHSEEVRVAIERLSQSNDFIENDTTSGTLLVGPSSSFIHPKPVSKKFNYISFIVNETKFEFQIEQLKRSNYFLKYTQSAVKELESLPENILTTFIPIDVIYEDQDKLALILSLIQSPSPVWSPSLIHDLYPTILKYDLDSLFREKLCGSLLSSDYFYYLNFSYDIGWSKLLFDLGVLITTVISKIPVLELPGSLEEFNLIYLREVSTSYELGALKNLIETKIIEWYKQVIMNFMKGTFEGNLTSALKKLATESVLMEESLRCLTSEEIITIMYSLKDSLNSFIQDKEHLKILITEILSVPSNTLLKRTLYGLIFTNMMAQKIKEAFGTLIPNEIHHELKSRNLLL